MKINIKNKKVLIIGASKNLGKELVYQFNELGCKIIMIARNENKLKNIYKKIGGKKNGHEYFALDLLEDKKLDDFITNLNKKKIYVDIIIHNIGGALGIKNNLSNINDWTKVWKFNMGISIQLNNHFIPNMIKKKWGRIIHISSITGAIGEDINGPIPYSASKAFLNNYVKSMGKFYANKNIVISGIMPGAIKSEGKFWALQEKNNPKLLNDLFKKKQSIGRLGLIKEIAPFVILLASNHSSFASGTIIPIHGGWNY